MRKILTIFCLVFVIGCGYKPTSKIVNDIMPNSVFVDVVMSKTDPQNTVAIKDAVKTGIVQRLGRNLADKKSADTQIIASIKKLSFSALAYDQFGYITTFRTNLTLNFKTTLSNGEIFSKDCVGDYDFKVSKLVKSSRDTMSVISDKDRYEAIENSSRQAFDEFISALAVKGLNIAKTR